MKGMVRLGFVLGGLLLAAGLLLVLGWSVRGAEAVCGAEVHSDPGGQDAADQVAYTVAEFALAEPGTAAWALAAGDLDGDGDVDLVSGDLTAWSNPYSATWTAGWVSATLASGVEAEDVVLGDLDRDGDLDLVGGGKFGLAIWQNPLTQTASTPFGAWPISHVLTTAQIAVRDIVVVDLDRDEWPDVAAVRGYSFDGGWLCAWRNPHVLTGTWSSNVITHLLGLQALAAGDLDRDGWPDLVTGAGLYADAQEVRAWRNDNSPFTGTWTSGPMAVLDPVAGEHNPNGIALADLDDDGWPDAAVGYEYSSSGGRVGLWRNPGTPFSATWPISVSLDALSRVRQVAVGDLDGDGSLDVSGGTFANSTGNEVRWWLSDGSPFDGSPFDGGWTTAWRRYSRLEALDLVLVDLDRDGGLETVAMLGVIYGEQGVPRIAAYKWVNEHMYVPAVMR